MSRHAEVGLGRLLGAQLRQPRPQFVDVFVAAQAGHGGAQLVAAALQFAAALVGGPCRREVGDAGRGQRGGQFLLCRSVFGLDVEGGRAGRDPRGQHAGNLDRSVGPVAVIDQVWPAGSDDPLVADRRVRCRRRR